MAHMGWGCWWRRGRRARGRRRSAAWWAGGAPRTAPPCWSHPCRPPRTRRCRHRRTRWRRRRSAAADRPALAPLSPTCCRRHHHRWCGSASAGGCRRPRRRRHRTLPCTRAPLASQPTGPGWESCGAWCHALCVLLAADGPGRVSGVWDFLWFCFYY